MAQFIVDPTNYRDCHLETAWDQLVNRVEAQPINLFFLLIFVLAVAHTFIAHRFYLLANKSEPILRGASNIGLQEPQYRLDEGLSKHHSVKAELFDFFGELEVVFGIWCIPLFIGMSCR